MNKRRAPKTLAEKGQFRMLKGAVHPRRDGAEYDVDSATQDDCYRVTITASGDYHCQCQGWKWGYERTHLFGLHCWHTHAVAAYKAVMAKARRTAHSRQAAA